VRFPEQQSIGADSRKAARQTSIARSDGHGCSAPASRRIVFTDGAIKSERKVLYVADGSLSRKRVLLVRRQVQFRAEAHVSAP
jgi:hypothetical protein